MSESGAQNPVKTVPDGMKMEVPSEEAEALFPKITRMLIGKHPENFP